jgi:large subunit ribosomal protein L25
VDISEITIGTSVRVADITLPAGVTTELDPESAVAIGQAPRVVVTEAEGEEAEGEAGEGGAEAPAGEAAPGGGDAGGETSGGES